MISGITCVNENPLRLVARRYAPREEDTPLRVLTSRMHQGEDDVWIQFHHRYYFALLRYAASRTGGREDASEIVQLVYLRVARHVKPFEDETEFWRWLLCIVRSTAVDYQRKVRRRMSLLEKFAHWQESRRGGVLEEGQALSARLLVQDALAKPPADDSKLLRQKYYDGLSTEEIATSEETTSKAVENRLGRLRKQLRKIISGIQ